MWSSKFLWCWFFFLQLLLVVTTTLAMYLLDLPFEVLLTLLDWLNEVDICQFGGISKTCHNIAHSAIVWKPRFMQRWARAVPYDLVNESTSEMGPIQKEKLWREQFIKKYLFMKPFEQYFQSGLSDLQSAIKEPETGNGFKWLPVATPQNELFQGLCIQKRVPFDAHKRISMRISKVMKIPLNELRQIIPDPVKREEWDEVYIVGKQIYELDDYHDIVYLIFEGASFILSRAHISSVEKGLRKYSMTEQSIPSNLIDDKDLTEVLEYIEASNFDNIELNVSGGWELEELDPTSTKVSYIVRLLPEEDSTVDLMFEPLCLQRARCLLAIEARIQHYKNLHEEEQQQHIN